MIILNDKITTNSNVPLICMPIIGETYDDFILMADEALALKPDIVEIRADHYIYACDETALLALLNGLRDKLPMPIIFTLRDYAEGGAQQIELSLRERLINAVLNSGLTDMLDIEFCSVKNGLSSVIDCARAHSTELILSAHFFDSTPSQNIMLKLFDDMRRYGADIPKLAVNPQKPADVLALLSAAENARIHGPLIAVAMGKLGLLSRAAGGIFGSIITFGSGSKASAPGQLPVDKLRTILEMMY